MHRAAGIFFIIIFYVVHTHMMTKITFRCMAKKRAYNPGDIGMKFTLISRFKGFAMTKAMKHQAETPFKIKLGNIKINYCNQPPNPSVEQVGKQQNSSRYYRNMNKGQ